MFLKAGLLSLALLLASRVLGLLRESAQAAAFGASATGDVVVLMLMLPDWLASLVAGGALAYVLLPHWARAQPPRRIFRGVAYARATRASWDGLPAASTSSAHGEQLSQLPVRHCGGDEHPAARCSAWTPVDAPPGSGRLHFARGPRGSSPAAGFQPCDLVAHGGRREVQFRRGQRKAAPPCHRLECAERMERRHEW